jgi:TfoX/Sxy family transcriptional regulator of competence genes
MAFDAEIASRVREALAARNDVSERKMFGGLCVMVKGHMCCGVLGGDLMLRVGPAQYGRTLAMAHARPMDFTGRPLTGLVYVSPQGFTTRRALDRWLALAVKFVTQLPSKPRKKRKPKGRAFQMDAF